MVPACIARTTRAHRRPPVVLAAMVGISLMVSACSSSGSGTSNSSSSSPSNVSGHTIVIRDYAFSPNDLKVPPAPS